MKLFRKSVKQDRCAQSAEINPDIQIIQNSKYFDKKWYLKTYPDVARAHCNPAEHYLTFGWHENRRPSHNFNGQNYWNIYPESKNMNPLLHYEKIGKQSGARIDGNFKFTNFELIKKTDKNIVFPKFSDIKVSIIIPVYNNFYYTKLCLQSILNNTHGISYEIIIADDNSTDETKNILRHIKNIRVVRNSENLRFLKNCNNAATYARGEYLCFLNNDTQVQRDWLKFLVDAIEKDSSIGLVGSKLIYPDGTLQEAGGIIYTDASGCNYGRNDDPDCIWYNYVKETDYISGASILLRNKTWKKLGGFDETFAPAYYEDTDLAFQIRYKLGQKVMYIPRSVVVHFEGKSNGTDTTSGQKKYQVINRQKFFRKWKKELYKYHCRPTNNNFLARDNAVSKQSVLVIDWKILSFTKDTGSRATWQYMKLFQSHGLNVKLYPHDWYIEGDYLQQHLDNGFEVIHQNFAEYIKNFGSQFDYVYLNRPNIAPKYIDLLRKYTHAKIIYQCHDLHYLRQYRNRMLTDETTAVEKLQSEKDMEFNLFSKMDVTCTFSFDEVREIQNTDETINARQIPLYILNPDDMAQYTYSARKRKNIMFVAGFQHTPNIDGAIWFVKNVFPKIKQQYKDIKLYLVGSNPTDEILQLASKDVIVTGFVTDAELDKFYSEIRLVVVPLRTGAGVKGKIIESVFHKVPVITTDIGIEGIDNSSKQIIVKNSASEFAKSVCDLYTNYTELDTKSKNSAQFIKKYFSESAAVNALRDYMKL